MVDKGRFIILYGENSFGIYQTLVSLKTEIGLEKDSSGITELEGKGLRPAELRNACCAVDLMCRQRLVIVSGLLERFEPGKVAAKSTAGRLKNARAEIDEWLKMGDFLSKLQPVVTLVLLDGKLTAGKNPLLNEFSSLAEVTIKGKLGREAVQGWVHDRVREKGGTISDQSVTMLEQLIGADLWTMENEIDKLLAYRRGSQINLDDVNLLVAESRDVNVFDLVDSILEGKPGRSQKAIQRFIAEGASPLALLNMLSRQIRAVAAATSLEAGLPPSEAAARLGIKPGYPLNKTLAQARAFTKDRIRTVFRRVLEADVSIKTGSCPDDLALVLLAGEMVTSTRSGA